MALIKCEDCTKEISDKALSCPNCGCPIKVSETTNIDPNPVKMDWNSIGDGGSKEVVVKEGCFLQTLNTGCMIIFAFIGFIMLLAFC